METALLLIMIVGACSMGILLIHLLLLVIFDDDYFVKFCEFLKYMYQFFGTLFKALGKAITSRTERFEVFRIRHRDGTYTYRVKRSAFLGLPLCWREEWSFADLSQAIQFKEKKELKRKEKYGKDVVASQKIKV